MLRILTGTVFIFLLSISPSFGGYYNGATQVPTTAKHYNGATWDTCTKWEYNGSTWTQIEVTGGTECSDSTDYVGLNGTSSTFNDLNGDRLYATYYTPQCVSGCSSGTLADMYVYHNLTSSDNAQVCIYADDGDTTPDSGDTLVECVSITSGTDGWYSAATVGSSINCSSGYFVVIIADTVTKFWTSRDTTVGTTIYYLDSSGSYSSPPTTLTGSWSTISNAGHNAYFTIGP